MKNDNTYRPNAAFGRKRTGILLCYPFEEKRLMKWDTWPVIVQPKLDGERVRALWLPSGPILLSSTEEVIHSMPHLLDALKEWWPRSGIPLEWELDGELYSHGLSFEDIHSRVSRKVNLHEDHRTIKLWLFDLIPSEEASPTVIDQTSRLLTLKKGFVRADHHPSITLTPFLLADSPEEVLSAMQSYVAQEFEGIIVRHPLAPYTRRRSTYVMKYKPKQMDAYIISGFQEEMTKEGHPKGTLGAFLANPIGEPSPEHQFAVGSGFTKEERATFWNNQHTLLGRPLLVAYQNINSKSGKPRFGTFVRLITMEEALQVERKNL